MRDTEEAAGEGFVSPPAHNRVPSKGMRRFLFDVLIPVLGSAAGLVAGLTALMYILGLLALWIPIYRTYTHDLATAWYAAALVPNTVVAGIGVGLVLATPLAVVAFLFVFAWVVSLPVPYMLVPLFDYAKEHLSRTGNRIFYFCFLFLLLGFMAWMQIIAGRSVLYGLISTTVFASIMFAPVLFIAWRVRKRRHQDGDGSHQNHVLEKSRERDTRWLAQLKSRVMLVWFGLIVGTIYVSIVAVTAILGPPPLPTVTVNSQSHIAGKLLAHNDGFWYVFHRNGKKQPWRLVAVPDGKVKTIAIESEG